MKKSIWGGFLLLIAVSTLSCGSSKKMTASAPVDMVEETIPLSGSQYFSDSEYYRAVQNAASKDRSTAQKIAMQNCRQELATNIQSDMQIVIENYTKNQDTGVSAEHKAQYQELAYTVVSQQLRDLQIVDEKMFRQADGLYRYYVCLQMPKAVIGEAIEEAIINEAKLNLEFDRERFRDVFKEQMDAFKNKKQ